MSRKYDLTGQRFGRLVVVGRDIEKINNHHDKYWLCKCDCGNEKSVTTGHLITGTVRSCGCVKRETSLVSLKKAQESCIKHGGAGTNLYSVWHCMIQRCDNSNNPAYKWYGGKGVKVTKDWYKYENFAKWAYDNGYVDRENVQRNERLSIDRIDSNMDYCPENCRWITVHENVSRASKLMWEENRDRYSLQQKE